MVWRGLGWLSLSPFRGDLQEPYRKEEGEPGEAREDGGGEWSKGGEAGRFLCLNQGGVLGERVNENQGFLLDGEAQFISL